MAGGTRSVDDGELGRTTNRVGYVIAMARAIEVLSVPTPGIPSGPHIPVKMQRVSNLQWEDNVRPDTAGAWLLREIVGIPLGV